MNIFKDRLLYLMTQIERTNLKRGVMKDPSLEEKRKQKGLSTYDVAALCGASAQSVSNWINSKNGIVPKPATMLKLSEAFGVTTAWLTGETDAPNQEVTIEFGPFSALGFSYVAYENLCKMNKMGVNMRTLMQGINVILESIYSEEEGLAKLIIEKENKKKTENEEAKDKKTGDKNSEEDEEYSELVERYRQDRIRDYELPIVDRLNKFFDLHKTGRKIKVPRETFMALSQGKVETDYDYDIDNVYPEEEDEAALAAFCTELRKAKGKIIRDKLATAPNELELEKGNPVFELYRLDRYYNH